MSGFSTYHNFLFLSKQISCCILALALETSITTKVNHKTTILFYIHVNIAWMCMCTKNKSCNFHTSPSVKGKN